MVKKEKRVEANWERFENAVDIALKTPAKHKKASRKSPKKKAVKQPR